MGNESSVLLKVYVDQSKKKVMFAEVQEDFVEILLSFFTLPLGKIARLLKKNKDSKDTNIKVGSLTSLYESVENLNIRHFREEWYRDTLLDPKNSSAHVCSQLKINLNQPLSATCFQRAVFLNKKAKFIITDDLKVIPIVLDTSIELLNSLGVENIDLLDERTMSFGFKEFSNLLKWSLFTNNPLTTMILGESNSCSSFFTNSTLKNQALISSNSGKTLTLKLLVQKSKKKVKCAQVGNPFVELLFSFLTIPLGRFLCLTKEDSSPVGIMNLYDSISCLEEGNFLKSEDMKSILLCPKISDTYHSVTDLVPIYEVKTRRGSFLREGPTFIVTDDLRVRSCPSIATISKYNTPGDTEILDFNIGEQEALFLLKAFLKSTSSLTECLKAFWKKPKDHVSDFAFVEDGGTDSEEYDFTSEEEDDIDSSFVIVEEEMK